MDDDIVIHALTPAITTFTTQFNRFAPLGFRNFIAVSNRMTAIRLPRAFNKILLLNPIQLTPSVRSALDDLGGVHFVACDLGHHMHVQEYLDAWPEAKAIGVKGLERKRPDVGWEFVCEKNGRGERVEDVSEFGGEIETVLFEGFITRAVAWYCRPSRTLIVSDLLMNLPATEQYSPSSASQGPGSWAFSQVANPYSLFFKCLINFIATTDTALMRRDAKRVAEWEVKRIVMCHGDVIEDRAEEAWKSAYEWFLMGGRIGYLRKGWDVWMRLMRRVGLGAW
jgi:hypothetical protein